VADIMRCTWVYSDQNQCTIKLANYLLITPRAQWHHEHVEHGLTHSVCVERAGKRRAHVRGKHLTHTVSRDSSNELT